MKLQLALSILASLALSQVASAELVRSWEVNGVQHNIVRDWRTQVVQSKSEHEAPGLPESTLNCANYVPTEELAQMKKEVARLAEKACAQLKKQYPGGKDRGALEGCKLESTRIVGIYADDSIGTCKVVGGIRYSTTSEFTGTYEP